MWRRHAAEGHEAVGQSAAFQFLFNIYIRPKPGIIPITGESV